MADPEAWRTAAHRAGPRHLPGSCSKACASGSCRVRMRALEEEHLDSNPNFG